MQYKIKVRGLSPIIQHNGATGLDPRTPFNIEKAAITKKRGNNRTEADDIRLRELETATSLYFGDDGKPTLPEALIRSTIEVAARKLKQGPQVREGLIVTEVVKFEYDEKLGKNVEELCKTVQFTVPVVVQRSRILRTRAKFDKWAVIFMVDCDDELVDQQQLEAWLEIAGRRIGFGDWRPHKGGQYGRFETVSIKSV